MLPRLARSWGDTLLLAQKQQPHTPLRSGARLLATVRTATPLHFCVVGSGPAGFYTVDRLLKRFGDRVRVDVLDRLPTPFGLVRSGVAPDHQDTKNVINQFTALGRDARTAFFGNVALGRDVSLQELRELYHGVVLAYGAESDKRLGIPGEGARNVFSAREFVWWYNGHPDAARLPVDLTGVTSVAVCGIGNVALDCARVLLQPTASLAASDVAAHALRGLQEQGGCIRDVHLVARRGPVQAACTPKELRELVGLPGLAVHAPAPQMRTSPADQAEMKATRMKRRVHDIISQAAAASGEGQQEQGHLHFQFYRSPKEVLTDSEGRVSGLRVEVTELREAEGGARVAVATGTTEVIPAQLLLVSIGYRSLPVPGVPFDAARATVPNAAGRVLAQQEQQAQQAQQAQQGQQRQQCGVMRGVYVVGWLKRGPTGIIGTNAVCADETVGCIAEDVGAGLIGNGAGMGGEARGGAGDSVGAGAQEEMEGADRAAGVGACGTSGAVVQGEGGADGGRACLGTRGLRALLAQRGLVGAGGREGARVVEFAGWEGIDAEERRAGQAGGKVREKVVRVEDMVRVAHGLPPST